MYGKGGMGGVLLEVVCAWGGRGGGTGHFVFLFYF